MIRRLRDLVHEPPEFLGRRGAVLLTFGVGFICIGLSIPTGDPPGGWRETLLLHLLLPESVRTALWVGCGVTAALCGFGNRWGWDRVGYVALMLMPLERLCSFGWSALAYLLTQGEMGYERAMFGAIVWAMLLFVVITIAGWPEPARVRRSDTA